jgi:hypothetical protein
MTLHTPHAIAVLRDQIAMSFELRIRLVAVKGARIELHYIVVRIESRKCIAICVLPLAKDDTVGCEHGVVVRYDLA